MSSLRYIKKVQDYLTNYEVTKNGDVFNIKYKNKLSQHKKGDYLSVCLSKNNIRTTIHIHILVACVYLDLEKNVGKIVNHIDGNKFNNNVENLEIITYKENTKHALDNNLVKLNTKKVIQYDLNNNKIKEFNTFKKYMIYPKRI